MVRRSEVALAATVESMPIHQIFNHGVDPVQQRQAGTSAAVVLGGLLEEANRVVGCLAGALERIRIAVSYTHLTLPTKRIV